jgi:outer membrane receptor protein involved in Fe transport
VPGRFTVRGLATNTHKFVTNPGIPGAVAIDSAGQNSGATPDWKFLAIQSWDNDRFAFSVQERWFSDGRFGGTTTDYVECKAGSCPVSTASRPTIDYNQMSGATYVDVSASYKFGKGLQIYGKVDNLLNKRSDAVAADQYRPGRQPGALRPAGPVLPRRSALQLLAPPGRPFPPPPGRFARVKCRAAFRDGRFSRPGDTPFAGGRVPASRRAGDGSDWGRWPADGG